MDKLFASYFRLIVFGERLKGQKYFGIAISALLVMGFVIMQPAIQKAYAVDVEGLPSYDDCDLRGVTQKTKSGQPEDPISANTIRSGKIAKTIFAEKEIFDCKLNQGNLDVIVDVTLYIELYENIAQQKVIGSNAVAITCLKDEGNAEVIGCESEPVPAEPVPVGDDCVAQFYITHPMEMNTVVREGIGKTVQVDKEVFICPLDPDIEIVEDSPEGACEFLREEFPDGVPEEIIPLECFTTIKKVEIIIFAEVYENLEFQFVEDTQFHAMRCVVLITNDNFDEDPEDTVGDASVETCQFSSAN
ncbi:MAG: hypothetical protein ACRD5H_07470 [Nitrososphaerales archaeon]